MGRQIGTGLWLRKDFLDAARKVVRTVETEGSVTMGIQHGRFQGRLLHPCAVADFYSSFQGDIVPAFECHYRTQAQPATEADVPQMLPSLTHRRTCSLGPGRTIACGTHLIADVFVFGDA